MAAATQMSEEQRKAIEEVALQVFAIKSDEIHQSHQAAMQSLRIAIDDEMRPMKQQMQDWSEPMEAKVINMGNKVDLMNSQCDKFYREFTELKDKMDIIYAGCKLTYEELK